MTYRITIQSPSARFSYYGYFPDSIAATKNAASVALPGSRVCVAIHKGLAQ